MCICISLQKKEKLLIILLQINTTIICFQKKVCININECFYIINAIYIYIYIYIIYIYKYIYKYYDRIDVYEVIDVKRTSVSKECDICHY